MSIEIGEKLKDSARTFQDCKSLSYDYQERSVPERYDLKENVDGYCSDAISKMLLGTSLKQSVATICASLCCISEYFNVTEEEFNDIMDEYKLMYKELRDPVVNKSKRTTAYMNHEEMLEVSEKNPMSRFRIDGTFVSEMIQNAVVNANCVLFSERCKNSISSYLASLYLSVISSFDMGKKFKEPEVAAEIRTRLVEVIYSCYTSLSRYEDSFGGDNC